MEKDATRGTSGNPEAADLSGLVRSTVGRLYRRFRSERAEGTLGDTALEVLTFLHKNGPHTLTELSEVGQVAPASMSQSVNRLTAAGYAIRTPDPDDRRKVRFSTTPEGAELAIVTRNQRNAWLDTQLQRLSPEDRAIIARACRLFGDIADSP
jgi:DNA-binding MarR family transcriptional regulator